MPTAKKKTAKPAAKTSARRPAATGRGARAGAAARRGPATPPKPRWSEQYERAVELYGSAVQLVQKKDWPGARERFERLLAEHGEEADLIDVADRARTYLKVCERHLDPPSPPEGEDPFLLGVYHGNRGEFDKAIRILEEALARDPSSDKILYAMAAIRARMGDRAGAVGNLRSAVEIDANNRIYALNDSDFEAIRDEPEFIDLVEPEDTLGSDA